MIYTIFFEAHTFDLLHGFLESQLLLFGHFFNIGHNNALVLLESLAQQRFVQMNGDKRFLDRVDSSGSLQRYLGTIHMSIKIKGRSIRVTFIP